MFVLNYQKPKHKLPRIKTRAFRLILKCIESVLVCKCDCIFISEIEPSWMLLNCQQMTRRCMSMHLIVDSHFNLCTDTHSTKQSERDGKRSGGSHLHIDGPFLVAHCDRLSLTIPSISWKTNEFMYLYNHLKIDVVFDISFRSTDQPIDQLKFVCARRFVLIISIHLTHKIAK